MRSLIKILLDNSNYGRKSLWWGIRREIEEHKYRDELVDLDRMLSRDSKTSRKIGKDMSKQLQKNKYLQPACIRIETIYDFLEE